jgi:hypothetical protein
MASAMIERAELPVHKNRTLKGSANVRSYAAQQADAVWAADCGAACGSQHTFSCAMRGSRSPVSTCAGAIPR